MEHVDADSKTDVIYATKALFDHGMKLYARRPDKDWPLTDCISFVIMEREGIADALTGDHHFTQAGFKILMER